MSSEHGKTTVHFAGDDLFIGITSSGHAVTLDTNHERNRAPSPMELLLVALGSCTGVDVATILQKKREDVTRYSIEVRGERREEYPRSYKRIEIHHIVTGHSVAEQSVVQAIELSEAKYCSVAASLKPTAEIVSSHEIIEG